MSETSDTGWYAVRCVFRWGRPHNTYEERVTLWKAGSFGEAIAMAEDEAADYVSGSTLEYLELTQAYRLTDNTIESGTEIFSLKDVKTRLAPLTGAFTTDCSLVSQLSRTR